MEGGDRKMRSPIIDNRDGPNLGLTGKIIVAVIAAILLAWALSLLAGCAPDGQTVKPQQSGAPVTAPSVAVTGDNALVTLLTRVDNTMKQVTDAINSAANAAKTVNGNQITNQGMTNAQLGCFLGLGGGVFFIILGVFVKAPALTTAESVYLEVIGTVLVLGTIWLMLGGKLPGLH